ncbi:MAG: helix-turn-helix domain-containing protein [Schumannella sp.]
MLDAAADAFVNDGLDALTFRRIAGRLGVADRAITELFRSVEDVLAAMLEREYLGMFHAIVEQMERDPLGGRLSRIYRYVLSAVHERPRAIDVPHGALRPQPDPAADPRLRLRPAAQHRPRPHRSDEGRGHGPARRELDGAAAVVSATSAGAALLGPEAPAGRRGRRHGAPAGALRRHRRHRHLPRQGGVHRLRRRTAALQDEPGSP